MYHILHVGGAIQALLTNVQRLIKTHMSILNKSFAVNCYPNTTAIKNLSLQTGLNEVQVYNWFKRRRRATKVTNGERMQ